MPDHLDVEAVDDLVLLTKQKRPVSRPNGIALAAVNLLPRLRCHLVNDPGLAQRPDCVHACPEVGLVHQRLIGRTDLCLFDPTGAPPPLLRMGDKVRFLEAKR